MPAPYRDDDDALDLRLGMLLEALDAARVRAGELRAIDLREEDLEKQIEEVRRKLARRASKRRLSLLDDVRVASPCPAAWEAMTGDERTRHCAQCDKDVHNLSGMSRVDAETFLRGVTGEACVRLYRRADGSVLTTDCPVGVTRKRRRRAVASLVGGGLLAAGAVGAVLQPRPPEVISPSATAQVEVAPPEPSAVDTAAPEVGTAAPALATAMPLGRWVGGAARRPRSPREEAESRLDGLLAQRAHTRDVSARKRIEAEIRTAQAEIAALRRPVK